MHRKTEVSREQLLSAAFAELANTRGPDFDLRVTTRRLAEHAIQLFGVSAASVLLTDEDKPLLRVWASVPEPSASAELWQLQVDEGPAADCVETGQPVAAHTLAAVPHRWPELAPRLLAAGYASVHALPLRGGRTTVGAIALFGNEHGQWPTDVLQVAQGLADVAAIGVEYERDLRRSQTLANQLQTALDSRVVIEQAKGVLSERGGLRVEDAFEHMRRYARRHGRRLNVVAGEIVAGTLDTSPILPET